ncbi:MAG: hypothetical protein LQ345_004634 [Seirophora villosa]|nr:MAG: hypothetical protein LQ345_004634 [Seirophora villosa]
MPSLLTLAFLTLTFSSLLSFASRLPLETRDWNEDLQRFARTQPRCQKPYHANPAGFAAHASSPLPDNRPKTPGRRLFSKRDPSQPLILCTPGTETYIKLTFKPTNLGNALSDSDKEIKGQIEGLVSNAYTYITREHLENAHKDQVINKGEGWVWTKKSTHGLFRLQVANAHHEVPVVRWGGHGTMKIVGNEVTWGVLKAAIAALGTFFVDTGAYSACSFEIWDGFHQVGIARITGWKAGKAIGDWTPILGEN